MKRLTFFCAILMVAACEPGRFELGRGPLGANGADGGRVDAGIVDAGVADGGARDAGVVDGGAGQCAEVAGSYTVDRAVANCMGLSPDDAVEVRQMGCSLTFPGPAIEGSATPREDGRWDAELRVGQRFVSCFVTYYDAERVLELGCGSICYVVLKRS